MLLKIQEPCHEKWETMSAQEKGAFCHSCSKTVTDFSHLTDKELITYFSSGNNSGICGRFRKEQVDRPLIDHAVLQMNIPIWKKFLAILVICFSGLFTSCDDSRPIDATDAIAPPYKFNVVYKEENGLPVTGNKPDIPVKKKGNNFFQGIESMVLGFVNVENSPNSCPIFSPEPTDISLKKK